MPIDEHLMRDEEILATAKDPNAMFYVTSKRVIRHGKGLFKETFDTVPFPHITAVALESENYWWLAIVGVISIIIGVFVGGNNRNRSSFDRCFAHFSRDTRKIKLVSDQGRRDVE